MDGLDRDFDKMITSEPCDYRRKYVRLYQVLGMLGLPSSCFFWVWIIGDYSLKKYNFLLSLLEHVDFEIFIHYGGNL